MTPREFRDLFPWGYGSISFFWSWFKFRFWCTMYTMFSSPTSCQVVAVWGLWPVSENVAWGSLEWTCFIENDHKTDPHVPQSLIQLRLKLHHLMGDPMIPKYGEILLVWRQDLTDHFYVLFWKSSTSTGDFVSALQCGWEAIWRSVAIARNRKADDKRLQTEWIWCLNCL